jgi:hypothetical protein
MLVKMYRLVVCCDAINANIDIVSARSEELTDLRTPAMKVMSGIGGNGGDVLTFDQLWFELPQKSEQDQKPPADASDRRVRRKLRPGKEGILTDLYANMERSG